MAGSRAIPILLLIGIFGLGHFSLAWQAEQNGTMSLPGILNYQNRILPNTKIPIKLPETGIPALDNYFAFMMSFFWMAMDERNPRAHLQANYLLGTLSSTWLVMLTEAHRSSSSTLFCLVTYGCELMGEFLGIGLFTPIWCVIHLLWTAAPTSLLPSAGKRNTENVEASLATPPGTLSALGYALVFGHVAPTLLMNHLSVADEGWASAQLWTILRLFHPVFVLGLFTLFKNFPGTSPTGSTPSAIRRLASKRKLLRFATLASAFGHVGSVGILIAHEWIPGWIKEDIVAGLDIPALLSPIPFWSHHFSATGIAKVDFVTGVAIFLQWDNICAASAITVWAAALYVEGVRGDRKVSHVEVVNVIAQALGTAALAGPVAAAAGLLIERDEIVVARWREAKEAAEGKGN